jgi:hypothetical protein
MRKDLRDQSICMTAHSRGCVSYYLGKCMAFYRKSSYLQMGLLEVWFSL